MAKHRRQRPHGGIDDGARQHMIGRRCSTSPAAEQGGAWYGGGDGPRRQPHGDSGARQLVVGRRR
uniref:Uncharacterized protein n=1 Tax=Oryza punctata TaxID=4537 RepID=A0A0E0M1N3_ORYPU